MKNKNHQGKTDKYTENFTSVNYKKGFKIVEPLISGGNKTNVNNLFILALKDIYDIKYAASNKPEMVHDIPSKI